MKHFLNNIVLGFITLVFTLLASNFINAEEYRGQTARDYLLVTPVALSRGLGNSGTGGFDAVAGLHYNPSLITMSSNNEFEISHMMFYDWFSFDYIAMVYHLDERDRHHLGFDLRYAHHPAQTLFAPGYDPIARILPTYDLVIGLCYGFMPVRQFSLGIKLSYLHSQLATQLADSLTFNFGLSLRTGMTKGFSFGLSINHIGIPLEYRDKESKGSFLEDILPYQISTGFSLFNVNVFGFIFDYNYQFKGDQEIHTGIFFRTFKNFLINSGFEYLSDQKRIRIMTGFNILTDFFRIDFTTDYLSTFLNQSQPGTYKAGYHLSVRVWMERI